ncbi:phage tail protein [Caenispirillum salinarum]|uniref:phage tail protein n=1 Tax=Caenispirillum salinarum TaxID=859058 RepID=UPI00384C8281
MSDPFIGEIRLLPYRYAPVDWMACEGQVLSIQQYTPLYAVIGTAYGGNGVTNFKLPEMRGHVAMGTGTGAGLSTRTIGQDVGYENVVLSPSQVPQHNHAMMASSAAADLKSPAGDVYADGGNLYIDGPQTSKVTMGAQMVGVAGGNGSTGLANPHTNMAPYLALQYCICVNGVFPVRS